MNDRVSVRPAEIIREYGPFPGAGTVHGVTFDGKEVWFATGETLQAFDPETGKPTQAFPTNADAGTAFDGRYLYQLSGAHIDKIDTRTGKVIQRIPAPDRGCNSGLTWAEGSLWIGQYRDRKILQIDPQTGEVLRTIESDRFVTGVTFMDGELWHGTIEEDASELRRVDPVSGEVLERMAFPEGTKVTGLESDGKSRFYCGGGTSGKVRVVPHPVRV